ncbi:DUF6169 family protein [Fibrella aquatica]|uniref:DUF6169 family protein n=1 Tax=Fibrella aquatica TaxID=3242487 RepID=UPI003521EA20
MYEFSFYASGTNKPPVDSRVADTILHSLNELFRDPSAVLLYVCESLDGRQLARKRTFDNWFRTNHQFLFEIMIM